MPITTCSDPFQHISLHVLKTNGDPSHPFVCAFETASVSTVEDMLELLANDLKLLHWKNAEGNICHLPVGYINSILSIGAWFSEECSSTDLSEFLSLDADVLAAYCRRCAAASLSLYAAAPAAGTSRKASAAPSALSPADEFKKSIKHDPKAFHAFKDRHQWNPWHCSFAATAKAQGLSHVLDTTFLPAKSEEQALFDVLQDYTFSVFTNCLLEAKASDLVCHYLSKAAGSKEGDAQSLYQDLFVLFEQGIAAQTNCVNLEQQLLALRLNHSWTKSIPS